MVNRNKNFHLNKTSSKKRLSEWYRKDSRWIFWALKIQSTFVISKSKGLSEILRRTPTSKYQICRMWGKINRKTTFHKWICNLILEVRDTLKILWKEGEIATLEQFLLFSTIVCYLLLNFHVETGTRFTFRDKRLFEKSEVEVARVDCICIGGIVWKKSWILLIIFSAWRFDYNPSWNVVSRHICCKRFTLIHKHTLGKSIKRRFDDIYRIFPEYTVSHLSSLGDTLHEMSTPVLS